jgi:hypothetical protein
MLWGIYAPRVIKSTWMRWVGPVDRIGEIIYAYTTLTEKSEWKYPLEDLGTVEEMGQEGVDWVHLA